MYLRLLMNHGVSFRKYAIRTVTLTGQPGEAPAFTELLSKTCQQLQGQ